MYVYILYDSNVIRKKFVHEEDLHGTYMVHPHTRVCYQDIKPLCGSAILITDLSVFLQLIRIS